MVDIFVSYKHSQYSQQAAYLMALLEDDHQLSCFFDKRDSLWSLPDDDLREYLASALTEAKAIAFFETFSEQVAMLAMQAGGRPIVEDTGRRPSWQEWELGQVLPDRYLVLYHSAQPRTLQLGLRGAIKTYDDLSDAAGQIASHVRGLSRRTAESPRSPLRPDQRHWNIPPPPAIISPE